MGRTIEREGATCPDNVADAGFTAGDLGGHYESNCSCSTRLGAAHVPSVTVTTRIILQRNSHSFSRRERLVSGKITQ
jgi:hypothetical protein